MSQPLNTQVGPFRVERDEVGAISIYVQDRHGERIANQTVDFHTLAIAFAEEVERLHQRLGWATNILTFVKSGHVPGDLDMFLAAMTRETAGVTHHRGTSAERALGRGDEQEAKQLKRWVFPTEVSHG